MRTQDCIWSNIDLFYKVSTFLGLVFMTEISPLSCKTAKKI